MPLFEYKCSKCGNEFEELVSGSETKVSCSKCGSVKTDKQLSVFAASTTSSSALPSMPSCAKPGCGSGGFG